MKFGLSYLLFCCTAIAYNVEEASSQVTIAYGYDLIVQQSDVDITEPDLIILDFKWFSFYPYENIDFHATIYNYISGFLYDPTINGRCSQISSNLPNSTEWFAFIEGYSTCPLETISLLEKAGCQLLLTYDYRDDNRTITDGAKDAGLPIVILSEENARDVARKIGTPLTVSRLESCRAGTIILFILIFLFVGCVGIALIGVIIYLQYLLITKLFPDKRDGPESVELHQLRRRNDQEGGHSNQTDTSSGRRQHRERPNQTVMETVHASAAHSEQREQLASSRSARQEQESVGDNLRPQGGTRVNTSRQGGATQSARQQGGRRVSG